MPEEIAATPGWVDQRLDEAFAGLPRDPGVRACCDRYAACLAGEKSPSSPTDELGTEFNGCRSALMAGLADAGVDEAARAALGARLEAVEAEIAEGS